MTSSGRYRWRMTVGLKRYVLMGVAIVTASVLAGVTLAPAFAAPQAAPLALALPDGVYPLDCKVEGGVLIGCFPPAATPTPSATATPTTSPTASPTPAPTTPTPTASPTASPTPSPTQTTTPPPTGWPNASNTGATGTLTVRNSGMTISTPGAVVENLDIRGCVSITARDVVFRNNKVTCSGTAITAKTLGGVLIEKVDVSCNGTGGKGVLGEGFTLRQSDVSRCEDAVYIDRNANVYNNYLHDLSWYTGAHTDVVQVVDDGDNVIIQGNFMSNMTPGATSAYMGDGPGMNNIIIDHNYMEGGGWLVYCSASGSGNAVTNNTFDPSGYGVWYTTCYRSGIVRTGNTII